MPCLESARSRARGGDERDREREREEGREIYDKATLILIHGTSVSILSNSFPPFEARKNRDEGKEGKKDLPSHPRALLLPRRRLLPPSTTPSRRRVTRGRGRVGRCRGRGRPLEGCLSPPPPPPPPCGGGGGLPFEVDIN